jgi:hypothetical protein
MFADAMVEGGQLFFGRQPTLFGARQFFARQALGIGGRELHLARLERHAPMRVPEAGME